METGKIVIVDDEKVVTSAFSVLLKVEGFSDAHFFKNPKDALNFIKDNTPDLVISDFAMPEMNGLEFLTEVKKLYPEVSKILLTDMPIKKMLYGLLMKSAYIVILKNLGTMTI